MWAATSAALRALALAYACLAGVMIRGSAIVGSS
jgi:hypothetical protein